MAELIRKNLEMRKSRIMLLTQVCLVFCFQVSLFALIQHQNYNENFNTIPLPSSDIAFARFIAGIMMHVAMTNELKEGMAKMKYSLNHFWRF